MICVDCYGNGTQDRRHDCPTCDGSGVTSHSSPTATTPDEPTPSLPQSKGQEPT